MPPTLQPGDTIYVQNCCAMSGKVAFSFGVSVMAGDICSQCSGHQGSEVQREVRQEERERGRGRERNGLRHSSRNEPGGPGPS